MWNLKFVKKIYTFSARPVYTFIEVEDDVYFGCGHNIVVEEEVCSNPGKYRYKCV